MDITKFNTVKSCEEGAWLTIKDFDDVKTDIELKVIGVDSKKFKAEIGKLAKMNENKKTDVDELELRTISTLVAITTDWRGVQGPDKKDIPFSKETANEIFFNSPHISNQVIEFAKDRKNFLSKKQKE